MSLNFVFNICSYDINHDPFVFIFIVRNGSTQESKETISNVQTKPETNFPAEVESPKNFENQEKKIWTRGEFTHQNAGIGGPDDNEEYRYKYGFHLFVKYFNELKFSPFL